MSEPTKAEIADCIDAAHDVMLERGWARGILVHPETGGVCVLGAISVARNMRSHFSAIPYHYPQHQKDALADGAIAALNSAAGIVSTLPLFGCEPVEVWNDELERTEDEVFDLLRNTAKQVREAS